MRNEECIKKGVLMVLMKKIREDRWCEDSESGFMMD